MLSVHKYGIIQQEILYFFIVNCYPPFFSKISNCVFSLSLSLIYPKEKLILAQKGCPSLIGCSVFSEPNVPTWIRNLEKKSYNFKFSIYDKLYKTIN